MRHLLLVLILYLWLSKAAEAQKTLDADRWYNNAISVSGNFLNYQPSDIADNQGTIWTLQAKLIPNWLRFSLSGRTIVTVGIEGLLTGSDYRLLGQSFYGNQDLFKTGLVFRVKDRDDAVYKLDWSLGYGQNKNVQTVHSALYDLRNESLTDYLFYSAVKLKIITLRAQRKKWIGEVELGGGLTISAAKHPQTSLGWIYTPYLDLVPYYRDPQSYGYLKVDIYDFALNKNCLLPLGLMIQGTKYDHEFGSLLAGLYFKLIFSKTEIAQIMAGGNFNRHNVYGNNFFCQVNFDAGALAETLIKASKKK